MPAYPKNTNNRNPALLELARGKECLLRVVEGCRGRDGQTTVACHRNEGKGMGLKVSDALTVWGCWPCHQWLDSSGAPRENKRQAFDLAYKRQLIEWRKIADSYSESPRAQKAAQWGLDRSTE